MHVVAEAMANEADRGCYLTFAEENNGCLYLNWSEKPVEGVSFSDEPDGQCVCECQTRSSGTTPDSLWSCTWSCACACCYVCKTLLTNTAIALERFTLMLITKKAFLFFHPFKAVPVFKYKQNGGRSG